MLKRKGGEDNCDDQIKQDKEMQAHDHTITDRGGGSRGGGVDTKAGTDRAVQGGDGSGKRWRIDRPTERQTDRKKERQTDRQTDRSKERKKTHARKRKKRGGNRQER